MAFPNHLSQDHDMPPDHHLPQNSTATTRLPLPHHSSSDVKPAADGHQPTWLNTVNLRHQTHFSVDANFLNLHTNSTHPSSSTNQWLSRSILQPTVVSNADVHQVSNAISHESAHLDNTNNINIHIDDRASNDNKKDHQSTESETTGGRAAGRGTNCTGEGSAANWQAASRCKAELLSHPLYEQLLSAHVACLRIATPVDQLPRIDAQLAQSHQVVAKYFALGNGNLGHHKELDQFMTHYILLLCSFKEQLQHHVRVHAMEAVMACWEIEQSLQSIAGVSPGEGTGATMSDDDGGDSEDQIDSDSNLFDGPDSMGFGPFIPTESERSLMERVRQELKHELKNGYKEKIVDIREEILRKRRAGKLPGNTTSVLKVWWQSHSKWPYPTEEDKARLVQETGLNLKQINNWFINQRKRNWHGNPSSSTPLKTKRKR